jgi:predicted Zn-ribbon and HTH transcriptional regulator
VIICKDCGIIIDPDCPEKIYRTRCEHCDSLWMEAITP